MAKFFDGLQFDKRSFGWQVSKPIGKPGVGGSWAMGTHRFLLVAILKAWLVRNEPTTSPVP